MSKNTPNYFSNAFQTPELQGLQYNTSVAGTVITVVGGTCRISSNLLQYQDFQSSGGGKKGGGKGGGGGKKGGEMTFTINLAIGICQGPVSFNGSTRGDASGDNQIWSNGGVTYGLGSAGLNGYVGNDGQAADPVLSASSQNQPAIAYSGLCYATATPFTQQGTPVLPTIDWEITGFEVGTAGPSFPNDMNPANWILRLLTDSRWGAGFPLNNIDVFGYLPDSPLDLTQPNTFNQFANFCQAAQLAMSHALDRQQPVSHWMEEYAELTVSAICWSQTQLRIVPYNVSLISNNGATWSPSTTPAFTLTDDDYLTQDMGALAEEIEDNPDDPVVVTRTDPALIPNFLAMEYKNGDNAYNTDVVPAFDIGNINQFTLRSQPSKTGDEFTNSVSALTSAQMQLQNQLYVRDKPVKFDLGWKQYLIDLMDIVAVNDPTIGWQNKLFWVTKIEEQKDGRLTIECREVQINAGLVSGAQRQKSSGAPLPLFATPPNVNTPAFIEPTAALLLAYGQTSPALLIGVSGPPPNWGGAQIFISTDDVTYGYLGTQVGSTPMGTVVNDLPAFAGPNPDTTDTLTVDLSESDGELMSWNPTDAANGVSLFAIINPSGTVEFGSYVTATLVGPNQYALTTLYRGLYSTAGEFAPAGSQFVFLGSNQFFEYVLAAQYVGQPLWFKFLSFNTFGYLVQSLGDVVGYEYFPMGASPIPNLFPHGVQRVTPIVLESEGTQAVKAAVPLVVESLNSVTRVMNLSVENAI
jgi:Putative phage tail protein